MPIKCDNTEGWGGRGCPKLNKYQRVLRCVDVIFPRGEILDKIFVHVFYGYSLTVFRPLPKPPTKEKNQFQVRENLCLSLIFFHLRQFQFIFDSLCCNWKIMFIDISPSHSLAPLDCKTARMMKEEIAFLREKFLQLFVAIPLNHRQFA